MEGKAYSKVANYFYLKDPRLANLTNKNLKQLLIQGVLIHENAAGQ